MSFSDRLADLILKRKTKNRIDPEELERVATASLELTAQQQPAVDRTTGWLAQRAKENGFGEDFEITLLTPKAAS